MKLDRSRRGNRPLHHIDRILEHVSVVMVILDEQQLT